MLVKKEESWFKVFRRFRSYLFLADSKKIYMSNINVIFGDSIRYSYLIKTCAGGVFLLRYAVNFRRVNFKVWSTRRNFRQVNKKAVT